MSSNILYNSHPDGSSSRPGLSLFPSFHFAHLICSIIVTCYLSFRYVALYFGIGSSPNVFSRLPIALQNEQPDYQPDYPPGAGS